MYAFIKLSKLTLALDLCGIDDYIRTNNKPSIYTYSSKSRLEWSRAYKEDDPDITNKYCTLVTFLHSDHYDTSENDYCINMHLVYHAPSWIVEDFYVRLGLRYLEGLDLQGWKTDFPRDEHRNVFALIG